MNMKKSVLVSVGAVLAAFVVRAEISAEELIDRAAQDAVKDAQAALVAAPVSSGKTVAVLPLAGDTKDNKVRNLVKTALTNAGKVCVEGKEDQLVDEIVKEIAWDERKEDILDAATVDKFGRLKSAQYLVYGGLRRVIGGSRYVLVELELHITEIATKRHIWGNVFARRLYAPTSDPKGRIDVPADVREMMRSVFRDKLGESLRKSTRLSGLRNVVCLPIVTDLDQYVGGLVRDVLTSSSVTPVNLDVGTRAEARFALKESPGKGDGILYGALRDASAELKSVDFLQHKTYDGRMEIQLWIEKGATREILWSDTLAANKEFSVGPNGWWDVACAWFPSLQGNQGTLIASVLGFIAMLIVIAVIMGKMTRAR